MDWDFILRIFIAGMLGGVIGFEREVRAKEAGVRTHFVVALGSALFMVISQFAFSGQYDHSRVAAQVVSGIGFIGAGVIIFQKNAVRGVTTAAGLWVAAAIGLASGAAMYSVAVAATLLTILCLETMHFITFNYGEKAISVTLSPVDGDTLLAFNQLIKDIRADIETESLVDGKANVLVRFRQKRRDETLRAILGFSKDIKIDIL